MKKIKDIAMWEETDSELAKYNIQQLLKTYDDLEEQYKSLEKISKIYKEFGNNLEDRINKALDLLKTLDEDTLSNMQLASEIIGHIEYILRGNDE